MAQVSHLSDPVTVTGVAPNEYSLISWSATVPAGTQLDIEVSYNNSDWFACTNRATLPSMPADPDQIWLRKTFTDSGGTWPILHGIVLRAGPQLHSNKLNVEYNYRVPTYENRSQSSQVHRTGELNVVGALPSWLDLHAHVCKPYVEIRVAGGAWAKFYLGSFKALTPPDISDDGVSVQRSIRLADLLYPVAQNRTSDYYVAGKNRNIVLLVREDILVSQLGLTGFNFPATSETLATDITFEPDTPWLEVINACLSSVGWEQLSVTVTGDFTSKPIEIKTGSEWHYAVDGPVTPGGDVEPEDVETPNVLVFKPKRGSPSLASEGNGVRTVKNYTVGPSSITSRGYEVRREVPVEASNQTELDRLAWQEGERLFAGGGLKLGMTVALNPLHGHRDIVTVARSEMEISQQEWWVTGWRIDLDTTGGETNYLMDLDLEAYIGEQFASYGYLGAFEGDVTPYSETTYVGAQEITDLAYSGALVGVVGVVVARP